MSDASIVPWGTLFLQVVNRTIPESAQAADEEERQRAPWWKAKKWAYCLVRLLYVSCKSSNAIRVQLNTLYARYGSPTQLAKNNVADYGAFAERFETSFAPEIFKAYLRCAHLVFFQFCHLTSHRQVELLVNGQAWLSQRCVRNIIDFFTEWCVSCLTLEGRVAKGDAQHQTEGNVEAHQASHRHATRSFPLSHLLSYRRRDLRL